MSNANLAVFRWPVHASGYEVRTTSELGSSDSRQYLLARVDDDVASMYQPLRDMSSLFAVFGALQLTADAVVGFANRYGMLGSSIVFRVQSPASALVTLGEPVSAWLESIKRMNDGFSLWQAIRDVDHPRLEKMITWTSDTVAFHPPTAPREHQLITFESDPLWTRLVHGDRIWPARYHLQKMINTELDNHVAPRMLFDGERLSLFMVPRGLIGAMWLQIAQAIDADTEFRKCGICAQWFRVNKSDQRFCTAACKQAGYRQRITRGSPHGDTSKRAQQMASNDQPRDSGGKTRAPGVRGSGNAKGRGTARTRKA